MNVPKLRFKEFTDEWEFLPAEKLFSNINEKNFPNENLLTIIQGKGTILRTQSGRDILFDESRKNTYKKVQRNDFIIHLRSFEAGLEIANSNGIVSPAYTILRNKIPIATMFYRNYFRSNKFINQILRKAVEGIRDGKQISYSQFKKLPIIYASLDEQKKIANFLSTVDKKISNLEDIIINLEKQKKGLLQQIFNQELRFKDENDNNYPDWEKKKLGDISDVRDGTHDSPKYINSGYPLITSKNIQNGKISFKDINYISKEDYNNINKRSKVSIGDILMSMIGTVGNVALLSEENFAIKNVALFKEKSLLKNIFLIQYLQSNLFYKSINNLNEGGTQKFISLKNIRNLYINLPCLEEQTKIADFLSAFDRKIDNQKAQLEHWKQIKKGLLQQMFV
ncbi:restriction endonuclease subunit S [Megamonas hypermegale]|uniref:restriction endonuclease subunit S n=1 Tax=Megamonas hypermegale TaxID=158847 RepID=UPI0032093C94